jgi:small subunit ribosomal protein S9
MAKPKVIIAVGKRKKAVARATIKEGKGAIRINSVLLDNIEPRYKRMRIQEPVILAGDLVNGVDISVNVKGGGSWGQGNAARTAIGNALISWSKDKKLKERYHEYDRSILVSDARRTEPHKPSRSKEGPRASKQQSKR